MKLFEMNFQIALAATENSKSSRICLKWVQFASKIDDYAKIDVFMKFHVSNFAFKFFKVVKVHFSPQNIHFQRKITNNHFYFSPEIFNLGVGFGKGSIEQLIINFQFENGYFSVENYNFWNCPVIIISSSDIILDFRFPSRLGWLRNELGIFVFNEPFRCRVKNVKNPFLMATNWI